MCTKNVKKIMRYFSLCLSLYQQIFQRILELWNIWSPPSPHHKIDISAPCCWLCRHLNGTAVSAVISHVEAGGLNPARDAPVAQLQTRVCAYFRCWGGDGDKAWSWSHDPLECHHKDENMGTDEHIESLPWHDSTIFQRLNGTFILN